MDIDDLESRLMIYLEERSKSANTPKKSMRPISASWLAILFAVLGVGSQYHDSPYHIRTRNAQKYIQTSFHFLRLGNFLLRYDEPFPELPSRPSSPYYFPIPHASRANKGIGRIWTRSKPSSWSALCSSTT